MQCSVHNQMPAKGTCVYCGKGLCEDCIIEINGKHYCKEHVKILLDETGNSRRDYSDYPDNRNDEYYDDRYPHNGPVVHNTIINEYHRGVSPKSRLVTFLLCAFFGVAGFHRFYVGKIGTGIIWLFTGGCFGIGWIVDIIMILVGSFKDSRGDYIV